MREDVGMMQPPLRRFRVCLSLLVVCGALLGAPRAATAQVIGTFRWQTQPFCNVLTVTVVQQGAVYQLLGSDNLCGTGSAPLVGTGVPVGGAIAFGLTVNLPTGEAAHVSATVSLATISGTWSDADGRTGTFAFNGPGGGSPRPGPASAAVILPSQFAPTVYAGSGTAATVARSDHVHTVNDLQPVFLDHSRVYTNQTLNAGACVTAGLGDGASGVFQDGGLVIATWRTAGINQNLGLFPASTRSVPNGFGVANYQICNTGTASAVLNGTVVVRLTVVR